MNPTTTTSNEEISAWQVLESQDSLDHKNTIQNITAIRTKVISFDVKVPLEEDLVSSNKNFPSQTTKNNQLKRKFEHKLSNQVKHNSILRAIGTTSTSEGTAHSNTLANLEITGTSNQKKHLTTDTKAPLDFTPNQDLNQQSQTENKSIAKKQAHPKSFVIKSPRFPIRQDFPSNNYGLTDLIHAQERAHENHVHTSLMQKVDTLNHADPKERSYGTSSNFSTPRRIKNDLMRIDRPNKSPMVRVSWVVRKVSSENNKDFEAFERKNSVHSQKFSTPRFINTKSRLEAIRPESYTKLLLRSPVQRPQTVAAIQKIVKKDEDLFKSVLSVSSYHSPRGVTRNSNHMQPSL